MSFKEKLKNEYDKIKKTMLNIKEKKGTITKINDELKQILKTDLGKIFIIFSLMLTVFIIVPAFMPMYYQIAVVISNWITTELYGSGIFSIIIVIALIAIIVTVFGTFSGVFIIIIVTILIFYILKRLNITVIRSKKQKYIMYLMAIAGAITGIAIGYFLVFPTIIINFQQIPAIYPSDLATMIANLWQYSTLAVSIYGVIWISLMLAFAYIFILINDLAFYIYRKYKHIKLRPAIKTVKMTTKQKTVFYVIFIIVTLILSIFLIYTVAMKPTIVRSTIIKNDTVYNLPENCTIDIISFEIFVHHTQTPQQIYNLLGNITDPSFLLFINTILYNYPINTVIDPTIPSNYSFNYYITTQIPRGYNIIGYGIIFEIDNKTDGSTVGVGFNFKYLSATDPYICGIFSKTLIINSFSYNATTNQLDSTYVLFEQFLLQDLLFYP